MPFIVDRAIRQTIIDALYNMGEKVYFSYNCESVYKPVNTHPDIQIHFVSDDTAFVPPELYGYYKAILPQNIKLHKGNKNLKSTYPFDIAYNISRIGEKVFLNMNYADEKIVKYYKNSGFQLIHINQGYAKCNICSNGEAAVTEDEGIYSVFVKNGVKALKIPTGSVKLSGFPYGFIGGASGCKNTKMLFCGKMENREIIEFFKRDNTECVSLDNGNLTDYGSLICFE